LRSVFTVIAESVAFTRRVSRRIVSSKPACVTRRKAIATRASLKPLLHGQAAGSLAAFVSFTILPLASTTGPA
jgi:hypothetical protein